MIAADKIKHMAAGLAAFIFAALLFGDPGAGLFVATFLGFAKERFDAAHPAAHVVDVWDAFATAAPAGVAWLACWAWPAVWSAFASFAA